MAFIFINARGEGKRPMTGYTG